jgi:hypothetical protein
MREFADIDRRIDLICSLASSERDDASILAEIGDVLATGYATALQADARYGRLSDEIERLVIDGNHSERAGELARERRTIADATRRLRDRLAQLRTLFAQASARVGRD